MNPCHRLQSGFTLIELMVVLVIVAVVAAVGLVSLNPSDQAVLRSQERSVFSLMQFVRDQSALDQKLYLVSPNERGLDVFYLQQGKWLKADPSYALMWKEGVRIDWQIDQTDFVKQQSLPQAGWVFWPSGEVLTGSIQIWMNEQGSPGRAGAEADRYVIRWNGLLQFDQESGGGA